MEKESHLGKSTGCTGGRVQGGRRRRRRGRERSPAPAPCERSKCSFHLQQELRQHQTDFQHTDWSFGGIDIKDQTASSRSSLRLHVQLFCPCCCTTPQHTSSLSFGDLRSPQRGCEGCSATCRQTLHHIVNCASKLLSLKNILHTRLNQRAITPTLHSSTSASCLQGEGS
ncbi:hypothetical protein D4764_12G0009440 [Takifugu flavidus]|uniref:Uncharacterized protein n=1 Tax=Takifugu flavidus TaxID=433684 RepID=A0A5C6PCN3_9TELE|nr:hypothetical protein D4764_12G0009440 [Takifugu flavidus]